MEKPKDFPLEEDVEPSSHKSLRLVDLNYYCLWEIFKFLDQSSQFAVMQACEIFTPIIADDLWFRYHKTGFDFGNTPGMDLHNQQFQSDALKILMQNYAFVYNIPLEILNRFFEETKNETFDKVLYFNIVARFNGNNVLDTHEFSRFPNLVRLGLDGVTIQGAQHTFPTVTHLILDNILVQDDEDGEFIRTIFTPNKISLFLMSLPYEKIPYENFSSISQCVNLRELAIASAYIDDSYILTQLVNLPSLEILTLETKYNNMFFDNRNLNIFERIMNKIHENPNKTLEGIQINGVPDTNFFASQYLKRIQKLNWMMHIKGGRIPLGSTVPPYDLPVILLYYQNFIQCNRYLRTLYVRDNLFYRVQLRRCPHFYELIQRTRVQKNYQRFNIVNDYTDLPENPYIMDLKEGCIKFICNINN